MQLAQRIARFGSVIAAIRSSSSIRKMFQRSRPAGDSKASASRKCCRSACPRECRGNVRLPIRNSRNSGDKLNCQLFLAIRQDRAKHAAGAGASQKVFLVGGFVVGVARGKHHAFDAEVHHLVEERSNGFGFAPSNSVVLVVTRNPRRSASLMASTAMSYPPSRQTATSCLPADRPGAR